MTGEKIEIIGSGRTDAGKNPCERTSCKFQNKFRNGSQWHAGLFNRYLPGDIVVKRSKKCRNASMRVITWRVSNTAITSGMIRFQRLLNAIIVFTFRKHWIWINECRLWETTRNPWFHRFFGIEKRRNPPRGQLRKSRSNVMAVCCTLPSSVIASCTKWSGFWWAPFGDRSWEIVVRCNRWGVSKRKFAKRREKRRQRRTILDEVYY